MELPQGDTRVCIQPIVAILVQSSVPRLIQVYRTRMLCGPQAGFQIRASRIRLHTRDGMSSYISVYGLIYFNTANTEECHASALYRNCQPTLLQDE